MGIKIGSKVVAVADIRGGFLGGKVEAGTAGVVRGQRQERSSKAAASNAGGDKRVFTVEWDTGTTTEAAGSEIAKRGFLRRFS